LSALFFTGCICSSVKASINIRRILSEKDLSNLLPLLPAIFNVLILFFIIQSDNSFAVGFSKNGFLFCSAVFLVTIYPGVLERW
jgi:hypothetical protein